MGSLAGAARGGRSLLMLLLLPGRHPEAALFQPQGLLRAFSSSLGRRPSAPAAPFPGGPGPATPWGPGQIRGKARGNEYQPSNIKRKHKHGWVARIRTAGGIQVILRRMLKGRKSLTH